MSALDAALTLMGLAGTLFMTAAFLERTHAGHYTPLEFFAGLSALNWYSSLILLTAGDSDE